MSQFTNILKNGWHPDKEGTTIKTQMKSLVGRGDNANPDRNRDHVSRPLHSLADPSTLPPPPQRRDTAVAAVSPPLTKRKVVAAPSTRPVAQRTLSQTLPGEEQPSQRPYRSDTTGLRTNHLPPPPSRRDGADGRSPPPPPPPYSAKAAGTTTRPPPGVPARGGGAGSAGAPPSLPPRLPPRDAAASPQTTGTTSARLLNAGAVSRLGAAGVSVPGLGIGDKNGSVGAKQQQEQNLGGGHMNELQNRFARFNTSTSTSTSEAAAPPQAQGTTWAQKQAALRTASQLQKDPSSVSLADARSAASTANSFRQRHGEQVAAGAAKASRWNQKYGVADKVGGFAQKLQGGQPGLGSGQDQNQNQAKKKPPPPPPPPPPSKKKPGLGGGQVQQEEHDAPPPIPMSTRPNF